MTMYAISLENYHHGSEEMACCASVRSRVQIPSSHVKAHGGGVYLQHQLLGVQRWTDSWDSLASRIR